ncbi:MAG: hypothetical protein ACQEXQ_30230 [Bacillota bacterium]
MRKKLVVYMCVLLILITGCFNTHPTQVEVTSFNEAKAVDMVLKDHPDFPKPGKIKKIKTRTGGPYPGTIVNGELRTMVEQSSGKDVYIITLTKVWKAFVNDIEAKSVWKYKVTPDRVELISSEENDELIHMIG